MSTTQNWEIPTGAIKVLDHGFVHLVDKMGDDSSIVQAARVSYRKGIDTPQKDANLIYYLMENRHTTPFEMVEFKFLIKCPLFVARQWMRHRTASINEFSMRYSEAPDVFYLPQEENVKGQDKANKQGSSGEISPTVAKQYLYNLNQSNRLAYSTYQLAKTEGISKELSRLSLPVNIYTEFYWKIDLHNLFHFLKLRADPHAQYEIREYAYALIDLIQPIVPIAYQAWYNNVYQAKTFSQVEWEIMKDHIDEEELKKAIHLLESTPATPIQRARKALIKKLGWEDYNPIDPNNNLVQGPPGTKLFKDQETIE